MTVYADQSISGAGQVNFGGGVQIQFALVHVVTIPLEARPLESLSPDHYLRVGWIALGNDSDVIDATNRTYWTAPLWIDFLDWQWHPIPTRDPGTFDLTVWASRIRWQLGAGGLAWLRVEGV